MTLNDLLTTRQKVAIVLTFALALLLGLTAERWDPYARTTPGQGVDDSAHPMTAEECDALYAPYDRGLCDAIAEGEEG